MPTRDYSDWRCFYGYLDGQYGKLFVDISKVVIEVEEDQHLTENVIQLGATHTFQLTPESTKQMLAVANGYRNYNCMQRDIRRQKRKLKEMRKRAKKEKYGTAKAD